MTYKKKKYHLMEERSPRDLGNARKGIWLVVVRSLPFRTTYSLRDICASQIKENETLCMRN